MKLTVVGCAGSFPGPDSPASCYLIEHEDTRILLDMGNGSLGALFHYADIYSIDAVALSHLHIDHCADLASFYVARKYRRPEAPASIPVLAPAGAADRMAQMYGLDAEPGMTGEFDFFDHTPGQPRQIGSLTIEPFAVTHAVPAFALRVTGGGKTVTYSGDTGPCDALVTAAEGCDVGLFEASYLDRMDNPKDMHLTGGDAARAAAKAGVGKLILTHLVAWNDSTEVLNDALAEGNQDVSLASAGLVIDI